MAISRRAKSDLCGSYGRLSPPISVDTGHSEGLMSSEMLRARLAIVTLVCTRACPWAGFLLV
jgi:hypothetical protein